jgi:hypothetical protein
MAKAVPCRVAVVALLLCAFPARNLSQQEPPFEKQEGTDAPVHHYVRAKDPKWYAKELVPLRQELVEIDQQVRAMRQARKDGKGTTGAVALDKVPEGVTADAQLLLLQQRRIQVLQRIGDIEDEARRYEVVPGAIRAEESSEEGRAASDANEDTPINSPEIAETKESLRQEREHLERAKIEANLLRRKLDLENLPSCGGRCPISKMNCAMPEAIRDGRANRTAETNSCKRGSRRRGRVFIWHDAMINPCLSGRLSLSPAASSRQTSVPPFPRFRVYFWARYVLASANSGRFVSA